MSKLYKTTFFYLILGLVAGVFYREFTKINSFQGITELGVLHTHLLLLGFFFFMLATLLAAQFKITEVRGFNAWYIIYNIGVLFTVGMMVWIGMNQVTGATMTGLNHMAGSAHVVLSASLVWFMVILGKAMKNKQQVA
ncbi:DUF2871 domain-containing protein [Rubeoparvulum massiliense]|uniref:DUF2871 domain-containing protein n=1 Tax=Rubeoparvulum massiliense TaxID=1631346 RepID=UPI00065DDC22|nr:DUF2871 domain-containing protein [Rubeoparvulum massiliense]